MYSSKALSRVEIIKKKIEFINNMERLPIIMKSTEEVHDVICIHSKGLNN